MDKILKILQTEYATEYTFEYDMSNKGQFTKPKIYDAGGDLSKRWYIYYSYRHPHTGKLVRQNPIYLKINRSFKTLSQRRTVIRRLRDILERKLREGYNPYEDKYTENKLLSIHEAFDLSLTHAQATMKESSFKNHQYRIRTFEKWLEQNNFNGRAVTAITKKTATNFLNDILLKTSPKNRNNTRAALSILFKYLEDNQHVPNNFISSIPVLKTDPHRNKTYTKVQEDTLFEYIGQHDPQLLLFIKFISYNFLRPIEVCRLQVKDISLEEKRLTFEAKNKARKTKIIPEILLSELLYLKGADPNHFLFAPEGLGPWNTTETNKRDYWSKRFKKVKEHFSLGEDYGLYSFRHTSITKLYRKLREQYPPLETKSRLMLITGHATFAALEKYLRDIDAELPEDYSQLISG
ncbi:tyrosine-type recombinase/integrase [Capnocytophaga gingivalis]|uniref:tyrosine-type recombinase/integrase n=1 Tax=Capnocytophaga gingivalis TaxID=1017 RepID=UPI0023F162FA|nr:site-specific integrase [Capnocytophaga gingivalis]